MVGSAALLTIACVLPPESAGDDDDGVGSSTTDGPVATTAEPPGKTSAEMTAGDDAETFTGGTTESDEGTDSEGMDTDGETTGEPGCTGLGPAGLPGVNPGWLWVPTGDPDDLAARSLARIDTTTMVEVGRYLTRDSSIANPWAVSVSLSGDVAVADEGPYPYQPFEAGLTKFHGDPADCVDADGDGVITTSAGPNALPWDQEECRAWSLPLDYEAQYGVAWTPGTLDGRTCKYEDQKVWTLGMRPDQTVEALLVDGDSGAIAGSTQLPGFPPLNYGLYLGAAVDAAGNLWTAWKYLDVMLVRVDHSTMDVLSWPAPLNAFALTVGRSGYVFTCGEDVARFDPVTETWDAAFGVNGVRGCIEDDAGRLWVTAYNAGSLLVALDVETLGIVESFPVTPAFNVQGVAIDFDGHLWGLAWDEAYRIEMGTGVQQDYGGWWLARVNSFDMTGFALASLVAP